MCIYFLFNKLAIFHLMKSGIKHTPVLVILLIFAAITFGATATPANSTPTQVVLTLLDKVKQLKKADPDEDKILTAEDKKRNDELGKQINQMIDLQGISVYTLQKHWKTLDGPKRESFVALFTELLTKVAYPNAGKFLLDLEVSVRKEKKRRNNIMIYTSVIHEEEGRIDIDFKLAPADNTWLVQDVYLDGVSLVRNLRTQCLKIIRENSYDELLNRMKKKIQEADTANLKEVTGR